MHARFVTPALALALGCTPGPDATPAKPTATKPTDAKPTDAKPTDAKPTDAKPTDAKPTDAKPTDAKTTDAKDAKAVPQPPAPAVTAAGPALRLAARRKAALDIMVHDGRPWLSYEGEPVPLVDGKFTRLPGGSKGMMECESSEEWLCYTSALAGGPGDPLGVWLTAYTTVERIGDIHHVYHHDGQQWREQTRREADVIVGHYHPLVKRGNAVIGNLSWSPDPDKEGWAGEAELEDDAPTREIAAFKKKRDKALRTATTGFVTVAGPEATLPKAPAGTRLSQAVVTADGTLWGLTATPWTPARPPRYALVAWAPGAVEPRTVAVPELDAVRSAALWTSDDHLLLGGCKTPDPDDELGCTEGYLAVGQGDTWERVPIDLPAERKGTRHVIGAGREPSGALWIALGRGWLEDEIADPDPVWYRPPGGAWQPVPVPTNAEAFSEPLLPQQRPGWKARGLVFGAGAIWTVLTDNAFRSVVLTTLPGTEPPVDLPDDEEAAKDRTPLPTPEWGLE